MRKIYFSYHTGYAGMDMHEVVEYDDEVTDLELDDDAYYGALQNAETYGIYPPTDGDYDEDGNVRDSEENPSYTGDNIEGYWEEYNPKKHDGTF